MSKIVLQANKILKRFGEIIANDHIDFNLREGEIHALVGENGAGKTTLMNILSGLLKPDGGEIIVRGKKVSFNSPLDALRYKIGMVHQKFMLIQNLTVAKNIALCSNSLYGHGRFTISPSEMKNTVYNLLRKYEIRGINPDAEIQQLSLAEQQLVEIIKMFAMGQEILIFDEPTSVLAVHQIDGLLERLRKMAKMGHSIIFITHKLNETLAISDRITVLREGKVVSCLETRNANKKELVRMMVGQDLPEIKKPLVEKKKEGREILKVQNLRTSSKHGEALALKDISFFIRKGEILGIGGVQGNGQRELAETIMGIREVVSGKVIINGCDMTNAVKKIIDAGVSYIPPDPLKNGIALELPITMNVILRNNFSPQFFNRGFLNLKNMHQHAKKIISEYDISTSSENSLVKTLSGGNQMKIIIGREMIHKFELLVVFDPTVGLDVRAIEFVHQKILEAKENAAILLVSTDLDELLSLSDRVFIMFRGNLREAPKESNKEKIGLMMTGEM